MNFRPGSPAHAAAVLFVLALVSPIAKAVVLTPDSNPTIGEGEHSFGATHWHHEGSFVDGFEFTTAGDADRFKASIRVDEIDPLPLVQILDLSNLRVVTSVGTIPSGQWFNTILDGGTQYAFLVAGEVTGFIAGKYFGKLNLLAAPQSAMPIPTSAWLFISALGALLVIGRQRRQFSGPDHV